MDLNSDDTTNTPLEAEGAIPQGGETDSSKTQLDVEKEEILFRLQQIKVEKSNLKETKFKLEGRVLQLKKDKLNTPLMTVTAENPNSQTNDGVMESDPNETEQLTEGIQELENSKKELKKMKCQLNKEKKQLKKRIPEIDRERRRAWKYVKKELDQRKQLLIQERAVLILDKSELNQMKRQYRSEKENFEMEKIKFQHGKAELESGRLKAEDMNCSLQTFKCDLDESTLKIYKTKILIDNQKPKLCALWSELSMEKLTLGKDQLLLKEMKIEFKKQEHLLELCYSEHTSESACPQEPSALDSLLDKRIKDVEKMDLHLTDKQQELFMREAALKEKELNFDDYKIKMDLEQQKKKTEIEELESEVFQIESTSRELEAQLKILGSELQKRETKLTTWENLLENREDQMAQREFELSEKKLQFIREKHQSEKKYASVRKQWCKCNLTCF